MGISTPGFKDKVFGLAQLQRVRKSHQFSWALMIGVFAITVLGLSACGSNGSGGSLENLTISPHSSFKTDLSVVGVDQESVGKAINAASKSGRYTTVIRACRKLESDAKLLETKTIPNGYSSADIIDLSQDDIAGAMLCEAVTSKSTGYLTLAIEDFSNAASAEQMLRSGVSPTPSP